MFRPVFLILLFGLLAAHIAHAPGRSAGGGATSVRMAANPPQVSNAPGAPLNTIAAGNEPTAPKELAQEGQGNSAVPANLREAIVPIRTFLLHRGSAPKELGTRIEADGTVRRFERGLVLIKLRGDLAPGAMPVEQGMEVSALKDLQNRAEVEYAELNYVHRRAFEPNDPGYDGQWHHQTLSSDRAWELSTAHQPVTVAIVDTPFQMNHPDLIANTVPGYDLIARRSVTAAEGFYHSTLAAGLIAGQINNAAGIAGMVNARVMPVDVGNTPSSATFYDAVVWAADNGARVVNISWEGIFSALVNSAGEYLENKTRGVLLMPGENGENVFRNYANHPKVWGISMTDQSDRQRSKYGPHIDFAAPGYQIYATAPMSDYTSDTGTSYSAPVMAGVVAWIMSVNPALSPSEIFALVRNSSLDLGAPGYDFHYGWGRVDFARVAAETFRTLGLQQRGCLAGAGFTVETTLLPGASYTLLRRAEAAGGIWTEAAQFIVMTNGPAVLFRDLAPTPDKHFYQVSIRLNEL